MNAADFFCSDELEGHVEDRRDDPSPVVYEGEARAGKVVWNRRRRIAGFRHKDEIRVIARILVSTLKIYFLCRSDGGSMDDCHAK